MEIYPDMPGVYSIGVPYDMQLDRFYLEEWGFLGNLKRDEIPEWITFNNVIEKDYLVQ